MLSHHQFSKPCESYRHVKDGESQTLAGNREPQTIWCLWLLLCGHPYMPRGYLYFRSEVELNFRAREHLPAGPLQQAADEQLWGDVTLWVSSWQLLPWLWHWGSRQGLLVRHREMELKAAFHHSGGKRKGQEMYLSAFVVWKWQEFFGEKKNLHFQTRNMAQSEDPGGILGMKKDSERCHCCAVPEPPQLCCFFLVLCTL